MINNRKYNDDQNKTTTNLSKSTKSLILFVLTFNLINTVNICAQDIKRSSDHSIITRYPDSEIKYYYQKDYSELLMPQAVEASIPGAVLNARGKHTSILYAAPKEITPLQILRNYEEAILESNGQVLFSCEGKYAPNGCDDYNTYYGLKFFTANYYEKRHNNTDQYVLMNGSDDQAFLTAVFDAGETKYFVEIGIDGNAFNDRAGIQVEIIEEDKMQSGLISAEQFEESMKQNGKIALYGIHFDHGQATIKNNSHDELQLIINYLNSNPQDKIYVVGHTDDTGSNDSNMSLSEKRAEAITNFLVENGVSSQRLTAMGVGPYAPVASNETDKGRELNRRVEIVKRLNK